MISSANRSIMKIYYNPKCSKCVASHKLLSENKAEFEVIEYLKNPLTIKELKDLLGKLNIPAIELIRKGEPVFKEKFKGKELAEEQWIDAMVEFPILMQRPIIVKGNKAVIGRPVEKIIDLINEKD